MQTQVNSEPDGPRITRVAGGLFLVASCVYLLVARGGVTSIDEGHVYGTAASLAERGSWRLELEGVSRRYSRYSVIPSILGVPFYWAAAPIADSIAADQQPVSISRGDLLMAAVSLQTPLVTAATAALLFAGMCRCGFRLGPALAAALVFAFGTLAFPYSGSLYVQPLGALALTWVMFSVMLGSNFGSSLSMALLLAVRLEMLALVPALIVHLVKFGRSPARTVCWLIAGACIGVGFNAAVNVLRLDHWLRGDYGSEAFSTPFGLGFWSLLFSSGKGLFWFAPAAAGGIILLPFFARERPTSGLLPLVLTATILVMISCWWTWHGGWSWGPRLLVPLMPVLALPLAWFFDRWAERDALVRWLAIGTVVLSVLVQLSGVLGDPLRERNAFGLLAANENESIYIPQLGPWSAGSEGSLLIFAVRLWRHLPASRPILFAVYAALSVLGLVMTVWTVRQAGIGWRDFRSLFPAARPGQLMAAAVCLAAFAIPTAAVSVLTAAANAGAMRADRGLGGQFGLFAPQVASPGSDARWLGQIYAPVSGEYTFYQAGSSRSQIHMDGRPIFPNVLAPVAVGFRSLEAGFRRVEIEGSMGGPPELFWTTPGNAHYKERVPRLYIAGPVVSREQRWAISLANWKWLIWSCGVTGSLFLAATRR